MKSALLLWSLTACSTQQLVIEPTVPPTDEPMLHERMQRSFGLLRSIERAVIRGELARARELAVELAITPHELGAVASETHVRDLARSLANAPTTDEASTREVRLAVACGDCHRATSARVVFAPSFLPPADASTASRMARHAWATDRMLESMVGNDARLWSRGLEVLAETPVPLPEAQDGRTLLSRRLQQLATGAQPLDSHDSVRRYGEIMQICAGCHTGPAATRLPSLALP